MSLCGIIPNGSTNTKDHHYYTKEKTETSSIFINYMLTSSARPNIDVVDMIISNWNCIPGHCFFEALYPTDAYLVIVLQQLEFSG